MPVNIKTNIIKYKDPETNQFVGISAAGMTPDNLNLASSVESTSTASVQHTVGSYFLYNGDLYKTTQYIRANDTITPGTNCERTYISDINAIRYDKQQTLSTSERDRAWANLSISGYDQVKEEVYRNKNHLFGKSVFSTSLGTIQRSATNPYSAQDAHVIDHHEGCPSESVDTYKGTNINSISWVMHPGMEYNPATDEMIQLYGEDTFVIAISAQATYIRFPVPVLRYCLFVDDNGLILDEFYGDNNLYQKLELVGMRIPKGATKFYYPVSMDEDFSINYYLYMYKNSFEDRLNIEGQALLYTEPQELTDEQKVQAQENIGADEMTVGMAKQLVDTVGVTDSLPYNYRPFANGADNNIGREELEQVIGGTVAWNQLADKSKYLNITKTDYTITANGDGSLTVTIINTIESAVTEYLTVNTGPSYFRVPDGHKFAVLDANSVPTGFEYRNGYTGTSLGFNSIKTQSQSQGYILIGIKIPAGTTAQTFKIAPQLFDLTQMFGSTIADYILTLETSTAGAGVAFFRKLFPKPYYAYNAGQLMSVSTNAHKMVGFNAYDNSTGKAKVVGGMQYQITGAFTALVLNGTTITPDSSGYFTPDSNGEITVTGGDSTTTCIHLVWDGERDGEYEPYEAHTYPLDDVELRGIPKLDANNNLYYDGDTYEADGTVTRKYGIVDLGTLEWVANGSYANTYNGTGLTQYVKPSASSSCTNLICVKYPTYNSVRVGDSNGGIAVNVAGNTIFINDTTVADATALKTAMSGVYLVYELATPTTEEADPYQSSQITDALGTEEFVDSREVAIPVGHVTTYQRDLRAKVENMPDFPTGSGNADYVLRHSNGQNSYAKISYPVSDVRVNGTSVVTNGIANITGGGGSSVSAATTAQIKAGVANDAFIAPSNLSDAIFYGLAGVAGDTTQAQSQNPAGTYTDDAKAKILKAVGVESLFSSTAERGEGTEALYNHEAVSIFMNGGKICVAMTNIQIDDILTENENYVQFNMELAISKAFIGELALYGIMALAGEQSAKPADPFEYFSSDEFFNGVTRLLDQWGIYYMLLGDMYSGCETPNKIENPFGYYATRYWPAGSYIGVFGGVYLTTEDISPGDKLDSNIQQVTLLNTGGGGSGIIIENISDSNPLIQLATNTKFICNNPVYEMTLDTYYVGNQSYSCIVRFQTDSSGAELYSSNLLWPSSIDTSGQSIILEPDTIYELSIDDGIVAMGIWPVPSSQGGGDNGGAAV